jgi:hypothetical protein
MAKWYRKDGVSLLCSWPHYAASAWNKSPWKINSYSKSYLSLVWYNYLPKVMNEIIDSLQKEHDVKMGLDCVSCFLGKGQPASPWASVPFHTLVSNGLVLWYL